jgi:hypothetical protein
VHLAVHFLTQLPPPPPPDTGTSYLYCCGQYREWNRHSKAEHEIAHSVPRAKGKSSSGSSTTGGIDVTDPAVNTQLNFVLRGILNKATAATGWEEWLCYVQNLFKWLGDMLDWIYSMFQWRNPVVTKMVCFQAECGLWSVVCSLCCMVCVVWSVLCGLCCVVCVVWSVVCVVWSVLCGLCCVVCGLWSVAYGLSSVFCRLWPVLCGLWSVLCGLCCVVCGLWSVVCGLWSVVCGLWSVVCGLWSVVCGLWSVVCLLPHT